MPGNAWKEYFTFSKQERTGVFVLLALIIIFIGIPFFYTPAFTSPTLDKEAQAKLTALAPAPSQYTDTAAGDVAGGTPGSAQPGDQPIKYTAQKKELFYFDPNTLSIEGWKRLGFRDKTIANILHYREAISKFKKPEDLYNVYRIRTKAVDAVLPYIRFGATPPPVNGTVSVKATAATVTTTAKTTGFKMVDVNTATAEDFKVFPGVTEAVANRIVKFRQSIHGFSSVDDVAKTYGLRDSSFNIMRPYLTISPK
jgi:competence protein ComEA